MPLKSGNSQKVVSGNIRELHSGKTHAKTAAKFGKKKADIQSVAIALSKTRDRAFGGGMVPPPGAPGLAGASPGMPAVMGPPGANPALQGLANPMQTPLMGVAPPQMAMGGSAGGFNVASGDITGKRAAKPHMTKGSILSEVPGRTDAHATHVPSGSYVIPADIVSGRGQGNTIAGSKALEALFKMGPYGTKGGKIKGGPGAPRKRADGGPLEGDDDQPVRVNLAGGEIVVPPGNLLEAVHPDLKIAHDIMDKWVIAERKKLRKTLAGLPGPVRD